MHFKAAVGPIPEALQVTDLVFLHAIFTVSFTDKNVKELPSLKDCS